jgi:hypothetical protein
MNVVTIFDLLFVNLMFISFAPPKEMNQRKGGRKCQLQPKRAPAALALLALPFCLKFTPFPVCPRTTIYKLNQHHDNFGKKRLF